jgi:hypothetical protein
MVAVGGYLKLPPVPGFNARERIHYRHYRTLNEARTDVFDYIERFHNPRMRRRVATSGSEVISYFKTVRGNGVEPPLCPR